MNKRQLARWNRARQLFEGMIKIATHYDAKIMYDETLLIKPSQIKIADDTILVQVGNIRFIEFIADPGVDEGLYTPALEFERQTRKKFIIIKELEY